MSRKQSAPWGALRTILFPVAVVAVLVFFFAALSNVTRGRDEEGLRRLEDSLRQAAVACYASEGAYPPDVAYLEEHYGLQIDWDRYVVHYDVFGSNLMPDITVLERDHETEAAT